MSGFYAAEEAIRFAIEAEGCGQAFYEELAECATTDEVRTMCRDLAEQEKVHRRQFEDLMAKLDDSEWIRPATWDELDLDRSIIEERLLPDEDEARALAAKAESEIEALDVAIRFEEMSVAFYTQMLDMTDARGEPVVQDIIEFEKQHVAMLTDVRRRLAQGTA